MTPRQRIEAILAGRRPDRVPFVIWDNKLPDGPLRQRLLDAGACVIVKSAVYETRQRTIPVETFTEPTAEGLATRTIYHTPAGELTTVRVAGIGMSWLRRRLFRDERDYDAIGALIADWQFDPCCERFARDDARFGDSGLARPATEPTPLLPIMYDIMGLEAFSVEWHERRGRVMELFDALLTARRRRLAMVATSPAKFAIVDANIEMSVVGGERFTRHYAPAIREACDLLHAHGTAAGLHLDARNGPLLGPVAELPADLIESFTPPPDCDVPLSQAMAAWSGKSFIVNFPSSVHLRGPAAVRDAARALLDEVGDRPVAIGVLENVPRQDTMLTLAECIAEYQ